MQINYIGHKYSDKVRMDSIKKKMQSLATETERAQVSSGLSKHRYKYKTQIQTKIQDTETNGTLVFAG